MKIALIEIGNSHEECLYSQIKFLSSLPECEITLICSQVIYKQISYQHLFSDIKVVDSPKGWKKYQSLYNIYSYIRRGNFDKLIFNTAQGSFTKKLMMMPYQKTKLYGTLHNLKKLDSFSQKLVTKKLERYFVLNDYLLNKVKDTSQGSIFSSYYPIFFPKLNIGMITKPEDENWIAIPGQVELKRRDYLSLLKAISSRTISDKIKFLLLGPADHSHGDGLFIREQIAQLGLSSNFVLWSDYMPNNLFHEYMSLCDFVMPLIHEDHVSSQLYRYQISGAFNQAFSYRKPLLVSKHLKNIEDFQDTVIFYSLDDLSNLESLLDNNNRRFYQLDKWSFEFQKNHYLKEIGIN